MVDSSVARSSFTPLAQRKVALAGGQLQELPQTLKLSLRGDSADEKFLQSVVALFDKAGAGQLKIPVLPNTVSSSSQASVFWMGPDEWLFRSEAAAFDVLAGSLSDHVLQETVAREFADQHVAFVDVSDYYTVFELVSPHAVELLARSCPLDIESCFAESGCCAQTRIGNAAVLLDCVSAQRWRIQVRWSYAQYLWQLFERSALSL